MDVPENMVARQVWGPWATVGFGLAVIIVNIVIQILVLAVFAAVNLSSDPQADKYQIVKNLGTRLGRLRPRFRDAKNE